MIILCLDPGTAHTGLAISREGILAEPLGTIFEKNLDKLVGKLIPVIARENPDTIVIGRPDHGPMLLVTKDLKEKLASIFNGEILFHTEDLSTQKASSYHSAINASVSKRKQTEHQTASAFILQDYLDSIS